MTFYKVYKIYSKNSNKYYINYTEKTVLTAILNKFILDYKTCLLNKNSLFNSVFNIIDKDDISIQLLEKFDDSHPNVMKNRIEKINWNFSFDPTKIKLPLKLKVTHTIEKLTGYRIGEYKNYRF